MSKAHKRSSQEIIIRLTLITARPATPGAMLNSLEEELSIIQVNHPLQIEQGPINHQQPQQHLRQLESSICQTKT